MKVKQFLFEMIGDSRDYVNYMQRADELDAGVMRLKNITIVGHKTGEYEFKGGTRQYRHTYRAESTDTWNNIHKAINSVKPVHVKRLATIDA